MRLIAAVLVVLTFTACVFAQTAPADKVEPLQATVTGVEGLVQVRSGEDQPWQKATVGMVVNENAEFRTGLRSAVRFTIPPDQTITLDRLGTVKVLQAVSENGKIKTNIGMKYGRTRYDIEAAGREHEATITSPSATLAVRGTQFSAYDQRPFPAEAVSLTGRVAYRSFNKKRFSFGGKNAGKTVVNDQSSSAAALALNESRVDPGASLARTASEEQLVTTLLSSGATLGFDYNKGIRTIKGGAVPNDAQLIPELPGTLNFVLRWTGNADINLTVISPINNAGTSTTIYPLGGFNVAPSGGTMPFDHLGGPNGGIELCFWPDQFPDGRYRVGAQHISGPDVVATLDVFLNGERLPINSANGQVTTATAIIAPINPEIATGIAIGTVDIAPTNPSKPASAVGATAAKTATKSKTKAKLTGPVKIMGPAKVATPPVTSAVTTAKRAKS